MTDYDIKSNNYIKYGPSDDEDYIFISYQSDSIKQIQELSNYLEKNSIKTWYAPRDIKSGEKWPTKIPTTISKCKCLLLVFTKAADDSKQVYREVTVADKFNKPILWIRLDNAEPFNLLYFLAAIQWYKSDSYEPLVEILKKEDIAAEIKNNSKSIQQEIIDEKPFENFAKGIYAFDTSEQAAECASRVYFMKAQTKKNKLFLLPTGRSGKKIFYEMLKLSKEFRKPFGKNYVMNDTETVGVTINDETSRFKVVYDNLFELLRRSHQCPKKKFIRPLVDIANNNKKSNGFSILNNHEVSVYGISLSPYMEIIGYCNGTNNEDIINDGPRTIEVNKDTKAYIDKRQPTSSIYSVGLGTALRSETLMVLAFDDNIQSKNSFFEVSKSAALKRFFKGEKTPNVPMTMLRNHQNLYVITTKELAERAKIIDYAITDKTPKEAAQCIVNN